jgi:hypothetical protein
MSTIVKVTDGGIAMLDCGHTLAKWSPYSNFVTCDTCTLKQQVRTISILLQQKGPQQ